MSSIEEDDTEIPLGLLQNSKKRRIQRACDTCRRKKIRCDGAQKPDNFCSHCIVSGYDCTYVEAAEKRGPPKSYVEALENRVEKLQQFLSQVCPEEQGALGRNDMDTRLSGDTLLSQDIAPSLIRNIGNLSRDDSPTRNDELDGGFLTDNLHNISLNSTNNRFFGKSSSAMLIEAALNLKYTYMGIERDPSVSESQPSPWDQFHNTQSQSYSFPEEDLMSSLIDLYFVHMNRYLPLLHKPTFERSVAEGLHRHNEMFALTLLLVCAVASRYSDDPRVLLDGVTSLHSCGWKWFSQVPMVKEAPLEPSTLHEIQFYCLVGQFLHASSVPQACWMVVGIGIRAAQDVGAHRRKTRSGPMTPEDELWKRAFWVLVCMDRLFSSSCGRPCSIHDEEFDIDMPIECDDEYWEHADPQRRFKQPPEKPSIVMYFNLYIKLSQILDSVLRTVYAVDKSKILLGFVGKDWEEEILSKLNSALHEWADAVPDHLRWDPQRNDDIFFNQSASLYCAYYHIQILVHRPFIPSPRRPTPLSFPSLAICTSAARSCSHVAEIQGRRFRVAPPPIQTSAFSSGVVLLLNIWGGKHSGITTDPNKEMVDVYKCMDVLRASEQRWFLAGRLWDILYELASVGDLPLPTRSYSNQKRERDEDEPASVSISNSGDNSANNNPHPRGTPRNIAGPRQLTQDGGIPTRSSLVHPQLQTHPYPSPRQQQHQQHQYQHQPSRLQQSSQPPQRLYAPPVHSSEIGQPSLVGGSEFTNQEQHSSSSSEYWYDAGSGVGMSASGTNELRSQRSDHNSLVSELHNYPSINSMGNMTSFAMPSITTSYEMSMAYPTGQYTQSSLQGSFSDLTSSHSYRNAIIHPHTGGSAATNVHSQAMPTQGQQALLNSDTYTMWSDIPTGYEPDEWGNYISNVSSGRHGASGGHGTQ